jgi:hypothetical protein
LLAFRPTIPFCPSARACAVQIANAVNKHINLAALVVVFANFLIVFTRSFL